MNKTININLGGFPFTMDEMAFDLLERYISSIKNHFAYSDSYQEIITDIEIRLGELLQEKTETKSIVTTADVEFAIKTMGRPEEFGAESIDLPGEDFDTSNQSKQSGRKTSSTRKLYRNIAEKKIGGVCAGIAAYFGIQNVMWVRLAFIAFTVTGGFAVPLYIIMWIFIPEAKTSADYLAMKGEKITVSNIAEYLEKEINNFSSNLTEFTDDISERLGGSGKKSFRAAGPNIDLERNIKIGAAKIVGFFRPLVVIIGALLLLIFAGVWISMIVGFVLASPILQFISSSSPVVNFIASVNSFIILGVPLAFIVFSALKLVFKTRISRNLKQSLLVFWLSNLVCFVILGATTFKEYSNADTQEVKQDLGGLKSEIVALKTIDGNDDNAHIQFGDLKIANDDKLQINHELKLNIFPAETQQWSVTKRIKSRGSNSKQAKINADCVEYVIVPLNDHELEIPSFYTIDKDCKYRFQQVEVDLFVPIGKIITISRELEWKLGSITYDKNQMKDGWKYIEGKQYRMTASGLQCANCTESELRSMVEQESYEDYISNEDIPQDALLQSIDNKADINFDKNRELLISFDKIIGAGGDKMKFEKIDFNVDQSSDSMIHILKKLKFYGTRNVSSENFDQYYAFKQSGNEFIFSNAAFINRDLKAINPSMEVTLLLPVGVKIRFDDNVNGFDSQIKYDRDEIPGNWRFVKNELLLMGPKGLKCINCN